MRDIIREEKFNNTVVGLELKCFESAHLVVSALQQLRPPSAPLACDLQIIPRRDAVVGGLRLLFVFVSASSARRQRLNAGGDEVHQLKSEVKVPYLLRLLRSLGASSGLVPNKRFLRPYPMTGEVIPCYLPYFHKLLMSPTTERLPL